MDMRGERRPHQPLYIRELEVETVSSIPSTACSHFYPQAGGPEALTRLQNSFVPRQFYYIVITVAADVYISLILISLDN